MVKQVPDRTGRFRERPHYEAIELDQECERIIREFMRERAGGFTLPISTDVLTKLIERDANELDLYADLSGEGSDVQGVTEFEPRKKPRVRIAQELSVQPWREHRLRTTLTHEYGHVRFHGYLWEFVPRQESMFKKDAFRTAPRCKRDAILNAPMSDWMEWQAGYVSGALLMPLRAVQELVGTYFDQRRLYGPVSETSQQAMDLIALIAKTFDVSEDAARVRLAKLQYLTRHAVGQSLFT